MKIVTSINGKVTMTIIPETEMDKAVLKELFQGPVDTQTLDKTVINDKTYQDVVTITPKTAE